MKDVFFKYLNKFLDFLPQLLSAVVILVVGLLVIYLAMKLLTKALEKSRIDKTAHGIIKSLTRVGLWVLLAVIILTTLGVPTASLVALIGASGLAIGLAVQNSLQNLAGGFTLLFSRPFSVGDYISSNGEEGTVQEISMLSTKLLTVDNKVVYIPNGQVSANKIINFTKEDLRRVDINFSIAYEDDFGKAVSLIHSVIDAHPLALKDPAPFVRMSDHAASSIVITTRVWTKSADYWTVNFDMIEQVRAKFDENGISIPYNQLDVHMKENN